MKQLFAMAILISLVAAAAALAQGQQVSQPTGQKTLAATMNVYAFPTKGQTPEQQSQDEAACYGYATQNTGTDPFELQKQSQKAQQQTDQTKKQAQQAGAGAGAGGAVAGAAGGALIGAVAGDAGKGAAVGAGVGLLAGRRKAREAKAGATAQAEKQGQQTQQSIQQQMDNFKKAFSVCMEAKNYMVKY